jgi:hypothetical protein
VLKKRFETMKKTTLPVVKRLETELVVRKVNALDTIENVWANVEMALDGWWNRTENPMKKESTVEAVEPQEN